MKHITLDMWTGSFDAIAKPGDTVDEAIVDQFRDSVPPAAMGDGYLQVGEPFSHIADEKGVLRPTYTTFQEVDGQWTYCGHCFWHSTEHQKGSGDPWTL